MVSQKDTRLSVKDLRVEKPGRLLLNGISFLLRKNENLAITGNTGSGKTTLALALAQRIFHRGTIDYTGHQETIAWVEQQHHFKNLNNTSEFYYQQRFNSMDADQTKTVEEEIMEHSGSAAAVLRLMHLDKLAKKPLIQLSNGENKKLQIAKALLSEPSVLIMDQPFIGLDKESRIFLHNLIGTLAKKNVMIILVTTYHELPECITRVLELDNGTVKSFESRDDFLSRHLKKNNIPELRLGWESSGMNLPLHENHPEFEFAIRMKDIHVNYGSRKILEGINWDVKKGERWLLTGPNGAGKSTLLSLVTADNPQAYANEIFLFDKRRGQGESIWDIKRRIGFLSPELHLYFDQGCQVWEAVASGLYDTIGLFRKPSDADNRVVTEWIKQLKLGHLTNKRLFELSLGEQRLVLLARALVKDPPLLILDEPCQGIDDDIQAEILRLIDVVCKRKGTSLVFVTHYDNDRPAVIDKFIRLENGRVRDTGHAD